MPPRTHTTRGFTVVDGAIYLLVVLPLIVLLAPALRERAKDRDCRDRQRQIVLGMLVYKNDNDDAWPVCPLAKDGALVAPNSPQLDPTITALATFEFLSWQLGGELTPKHFACPLRPEGQPHGTARSFEGPPPGSAWAAQGPKQFGFSYDWSAPANATATRVVTADRDRRLHPDATVFAAHADGHVAPITDNGTGFRNPEVPDDDIYTAAGDGPMHLPGNGSTSRAFVR